MTNPNSEREPEARTQSSLRSPFLTRAAAALGAFLLLALAGGTWRLWIFVQKDLGPLAQQAVTETLSRPVQLGAIKQVSLTGVTFGNSSIPATATDPDRATVDTVEVGYDPLALLLRRTLRLDVALVHPNLYLQQDSQGRWITTTIAAQKPQNGPIRTVLDKIRFRDGNLTLLASKEFRNLPTPEMASGSGEVGIVSNLSPFPVLPSPLVISASYVNGVAKIRQKGQLIIYEAVAKPNNGGDLTLNGEYRPLIQEHKVKLLASDLLAADISRVVKLPLGLQTGLTNGNLSIQLRQDQPALLYGSASIQGTTFQIPRLPHTFSNSQGNLDFQGTEIKLNNVSSVYGKVPLIANGTVDSQKGYKLTGQVKSVSVPDAQQTLNVKLPFVALGLAKADLQLTGEIAKPKLSGLVATIKAAKIDKVDFSQASAKFEFVPTAALITFKDIIGKPTLGGQITGNGAIKLNPEPELNFNFNGVGLPGDAIATVYESKPTFQIGTISATANLAGAGNNVRTVVQFNAPQATYPGTGEVTVAANQLVTYRNVNLNVAGGKVAIAGSYVNQQFSAIADASQLQLARLIDTTQIKNVSLQGGQINGRVAISGTTGPFKIATIRSSGARLAIAGGTITAANIQVNNDIWKAQLQANNIRLGQLLPQIPPAFQSPATGTFQLAGTTQSFQPETIQATGFGSLSVGGGTVTASNIQVNQGKWQSQVQANSVQLASLAKVAPQFIGPLTGQFNVAGTTESFQPQTIQATGKARLVAGGGTYIASNIQVNEGKFQALVNANGIQLKRFGEDLRGLLSGTAQVAGLVTALDLPSVRAAGNVNLSQGVSIIQKPLDAKFGWDGEKLIIAQATSPGITADGLIFAKTGVDIAPKLTGVNLNVQAQNYDLKELPFELPSALKLAGRGDFLGKVEGSLPKPNATGQLQLRNLVVNNLPFEPLLAGSFESDQQRGSKLNVAGGQDQINLNLSLNNQLQNFLIKRDTAIATGQTQGENLIAKVENFPIAALKYNLPQNTILGTGTVGGLLTGDFQVNQTKSSLVGNIAIAKPVLGRLQGDRLLAQINYANGVAKIASGEFDYKKSRYTLVDGTFAQGTQGPQIQAKVNVSQGEIQDILTALQIFNIQDLQRGMKAPVYGNASDLATQSVGLPGKPLLTQIQRLSEIDALLAQQEQQRRQASPLPEIADFKGTFNGNIAVNTGKTGLIADFNLNAQNLVWGRADEPGRFYQAKSAIALGKYENGAITFQPFRLDSDRGLFAFTGQLGGKEQFGKLEVNNFPVETLNSFVKLPINVTGNLNASASLAGSVANPQARGELQLGQGSLNQKPVQSATSSFNYANGRLNFGSTVALSTAQPIQITGSIPYKLPFATVAPDNDQLSLNVNVQNEGLSLLNLLNNQVAFQKGQGQIQVKVGGTLQQPQVVGTANVSNGIFTAQALPEALTNVTGNVRFDFDRLIVDNFKGDFSRGNIVAQGELPISQDSQTAISNPLTVSLQKLKLNLKGLYQGNASGDIQVTGSALNPILGGAVQLAQGRVFLNDSTKVTTPTSSTNTTNPAKTTSGTPTSTGFRFNNLQLALGKGVDIVRPLIDFQATGTLNVNGSLTNPLPEGEIRIRGGRVNLFTTQFLLARDYKNTAIFNPNQGLDPELDIRLFAKVQEIVQNRIPSSPLSSEINDTISTSQLGALNTVRIQARIQGPASQLNDNLKLTSEPSRSETEIVALLGGGFVQTLGRGDSALGLANLAGSAVLGNFQGTFNQIGDAFGLTEFRLFPTLITEGRNRGSTLGLAAEAGIDISHNFSVSALRVLTTNQPTQFGINYRINDEFRARTSTDLGSDTRALLEYESRF